MKPSPPASIRTKASRPADRRSARAWVCVALSLTWAGPVRLLQAQPRPGSGLEAFATLAQRNIFDPTRTPSRPRDIEDRNERREPAPQAEVINLSGTMLYGSNAFAFFGGSDPQYRQILSPHETIASLKVAEITVAHVVLQGDNQQWILPVGRQLRREKGRTWEISSALSPLPALPSTPPATESRSPEDGPPADAPPPEMNELLKRMMERREKEIAP